MLLAAVAPEYFLADSVEGFFRASTFLKKLIKKGNREWKFTHILFACARGFCTRTPEGAIDECDIDRLWTLIETKRINGPPISEEELQARGKNDMVIKLIAVLQILWFVIQTLLRAIQRYQITTLEIMTVAFVFCSVFTYALSLNQPQDVVYPVILELRSVVPATDQTEQKSNRSNHAESGAISPQSRPDRVQSHLESNALLAARNISFAVLGLFAGGFGALHCLAWNSPFPTSKERLAWRICSLVTTTLSALFTCLFIVAGTGSDNDLMDFLIWSTIAAITLLYIIGRTTIIVLAFMTLRALPADAFETVSWNNYFPHFAA